MKSAALGGIELDIAIGGQTGADTRLYASQQTLLYRSFAPVVLVLKVLLNQQDLDMPFTGTSCHIVIIWNHLFLTAQNPSTNSLFLIFFGCISAARWFGQLQALCNRGTSYSTTLILGWKR